MGNNYLLFSHRQARYLVEGHGVREIVWLPALVSLPEMPVQIAGGFNLRGRVVPVIDLDLCFGRVPQNYTASACVIVLEIDQVQIGILANEMQDVLQILPTDLEPVDSYSDLLHAPARFICGIAKFGADLAMLLNIKELLSCAPPEADAQLIESSHPTTPDACSDGRHQRAIDLAGVLADDDSVGITPFAVFTLGDEHYGIALEAVREFAHLRLVVPVPCSPPWIGGTMNLRGEILTLIDLRALLGLTDAGELREVVVCRVGPLLFGVLVSTVVDVMDISPSDISAPPAAPEAGGRGAGLGVAKLGTTSITLLDLAKTMVAGGIHDGVSSS